MMIMLVATIILVVANAMESMSLPTCPQFHLSVSLVCCYVFPRVRLVEFLSFFQQSCYSDSVGLVGAYEEGTLFGTKVLS